MSYFRHNIFNQCLQQDIIKIFKGSPGWNAVHHMSWSLVISEMNYNKVEGESLGIYAGINMNKRYLYGTKFTVMTDHEALPDLYNHPGKPTNDRVDRHRSKLGAYQFTVRYVPGDQNICDYGSRHPDPLPDNMTKEEKEEMGIETEDEEKEI